MLHFGFSKINQFWPLAQLVSLNSYIYTMFQDMYSDGTIVCQERFYPIHQLVLSSCSDYFGEVFKRCARLNNRHPLIILKDVQPEHMEAILDYMYKGEVNVLEKNLPDLIKAAEIFKLKGLIQPVQNTPYSQSRKRAREPSRTSTSRKTKKTEGLSAPLNPLDQCSNNVEKKMYYPDKQTPSQSENEDPLIKKDNSLVSKCYVIR